MRTKKNYEEPVLDDELLGVFKEVFKGDDESYQEAIHEVKRAYHIIREEDDWNYGDDNYYE